MVYTDRDQVSTGDLIFLLYFKVAELLASNTPTCLSADGKGNEPVLLRILKIINLRIKI